MAVVAPPSFQSKLDYWTVGSSAARIAKPSGQMTDIMSYQYSQPPPANVADMAYLPADYANMHPASGFVPESGLSSKDHRDAMPRNLNMKLTRPMSTSMVHTSPQSAMAQQVSLSQDANSLSIAAEKRRNKLGYHRTSVACGHCRRRKIRCIPSANDIQGRCANCIRLKKECSFYPVDQQPPVDTRKSSGARPSSTMAPPTVKTTGIESYASDHKLSSHPSVSRSFEYTHTGITNWMAADTSPTSSKPGDLSASWRSYTGESPITPAFSPYTTNPPPPTAAWTPQSDPPTRDEMSWSYPPPPRSMSFGPDGLLGHAQYPPISQMASGLPSRPFDRKAGHMPDMYTSPISTTVPGVDSIHGTTLDHAVSLSAGAVGPHAYGGWQPYSYSKPAESHDAYVGWAAEHGTATSNELPTSSSMYYTGR